MRQEQARKLVKEIYKHADRDNCYDCKQLLRALGLDPSKAFDEVFNIK